MENVVFCIEYKDGEETVFAVLFIGIMDEEFIYAKRCSIISARNDEPFYVKIAKKECVDTTERWISDWKCPFRTIEVSDKLGINDPRLELDPLISEDIMQAISAAITELNADA